MKTKYLLIVFFISISTIYSQNFWQDMGGGGGDYNGGGARSITITKTGAIIVGYENKIIRSTDNGNTFWVTYPTPSTVLAVACDRSTGYVYASFLPKGSQYYGIYRSTDDGLSWAYVGLNGYNIQNIVINKQGYIFTGGFSPENNGGVFRSTDRGITWVNFLGPKASVNCLYIDDDQNIYVGTKSEGGDCIVNRSSDNGNSWIVIGELGDLGSNGIYGLAVDHDKNLFAYTGAIYRRINGSNSWEKLGSSYSFHNTPNKESFDCVITQNNIAYLSSNGYGVYCSVDTFKTWNLVNSGLSSVSCYSLAINYLNGYLYVGSMDRISRSVNPVDPPAPPKLLSPNMGSIITTLVPTFDWEDAQNAISYRIQILKDSLFSIIVLDTNSIQQSNLTLPSKRLANNTKYYWRINASNNAGEGSWSAIWSFTIQAPTDIKGMPSSVPNLYMLSQNYPNPFNPTTMISYQLPVAGYVTLKVYDMLGIEVEVIVNEYKTPGYYNIKFDGSRLTNGIYLYRLLSNNFSSTKKFVLLK